MAFWIFARYFNAAFGSRPNRDRSRIDDADNSGLGNSVHRAVKHGKCGGYGHAPAQIRFLLPQCRVWRIIGGVIMKLIRPLKRLPRFCPGLLLVSFCLVAQAEKFRIAPVNTNSLGVWEGDRPVLVYNHGVLLAPGVPADRARSTYIHPLYGMDGEVLTDDFPKDHYHHRGVFWAWPHVKVGGKEYDLWMIQGIKQEFEKWVAREAGPDRAVLKMQNAWMAGGRKVMDEQVSITVHPATRNNRAIDLAFTWTPVGEEIALSGAEGKSYGGITIRYAPHTNAVITTPLGNEPKDLAMTRLAWADYSAQFEQRGVASGAALFVPPSHPDYPPMWLTRHYGALCLGWPGVQSTTFPAGKPIHCEYRLWVHRGQPDGKQLTQAYADYTNGIPAKAGARKQNR